MSKPTRIRHRFYHRTNAAKGILADGFRDATGNCMMSGFTVTGVWVSDRPLDANEGAAGDTLLQIDLALALRELEFYEVKEAGKPFREWCLPAQLLNRGSIRVVHSESPELQSMAQSNPRRGSEVL